MITQEQVNELFEYRDGVLYWKVSTSYNVKVGDAAGNLNSTGYIQIMINGKQYLAHRIIYLMFNGDLPKYVDHRDNDPLNNKIDNLRSCTCSQNNCNSRISIANTSGVKGVSWHKRDKKWIARIKLNRKEIHLGYFTELSDATEVVKIARDKYHGDFARHF